MEADRCPQAKLIGELEDLGQKAAVIFDFADSKVLRIVAVQPSPTSSPVTGGPAFGQQAHGATPLSSSPFARPQIRTGSSSGSESPQAPSEEAQLVAEAFNLYFRSMAFLNRAIFKIRAFCEALPRAGPQGDIVTSPELNDAAQWLRRRYNDCYEKAEFVKARMSEVQGDPVSVNADKLIYDRALELVRVFFLYLPSSHYQ